MTANWKVVRTTLAWLLVALMAMAIVIASPYAVESDAASSPTSASEVSVKKVANGKWAAYTNGKINTSLTGFYKNQNGWWYVRNGYVDFSANGIYKNKKNGIWYKTTNGKVTFKETGVFKNFDNNTWWRVENSRVNFQANSIYKNSKGWWKTTNGKVLFNENGVFKNENGWWKVVNSRVDFGFEGIASNANGLWYLKNGKVQFGETGSTKYEGKYYYIFSGRAVESSTMDQLISVIEEVAKEAPSSKALIVQTLLEDDVINEVSAEYGIPKYDFRGDILTYAAKNSDVDWNDQAYNACVDTLLDDNAEPVGIPRSLMREILVLSLDKDGYGFEASEADAALAKVDQDKGIWDKQALAFAKDTVEGIEKNKVDKEALKYTLVEFGFTESEAQYAVDHI